MRTGVHMVAPAGLLAEKVVVITGASQGIGETAARGFAAAGAKLVLGARRVPVIQRIAQEIAAAGAQVFACEVDVTDEDSVKRFIAQALERFGRVDGAFNNAGTDPKVVAPLHEESLDQWSELFTVKVDGTFLCMKYELPAMLSGGGGAIVNVGSAVGLRGMKEYPSVCASQGAVFALTRAASAGYAAANIRVNAVAPGQIVTPERLAGAGAGHAVGDSFCPMGRPGGAHEVAAVVAWLLSDFASYVTGVTVPVDGGWVAGE